MQSEDRQPAPEPGVYDHVPEEDYHSWNHDVLSKSKLWPAVLDVKPDGELVLSMAKLRHYLLNPLQQTDAMRVGSALDCLLLEPGDFDHRFTMAKSCEAVMQSGKRAGELCGSPGVGMYTYEDGSQEWRCGKHKADPGAIPEDQTLLDHIEMATVRGMARSLRSHPTVGRYLSEPHQPQVAIVGSLYGWPFKGRFDLLRGRRIIDIKSGRNPSRGAFERDAIKLGYHVQAFLYTALADQHDIDPDGFEFAVCGKSSVYGAGKDAVYPVHLYRASDRLIDLGRQHAEQLVYAFDRAVHDDYWPDHHAEPEQLSVPRWLNFETEYVDDEVEEVHGE